MKKLSALFLCTVLLIGIVACATPVDETGSTTTTSATTTASTTTTTEATSTTTDESSVPSAAIQSTLATMKPSVYVPSPTTTLTRPEVPPSDAECQKLIARYIRYTTLYESSMINFLVEVGAATRGRIEASLKHSIYTDVSGRNLERAIADTIVCETHLSRFLADNEYEQGTDSILFVREEKPLVNKTVDDIDANGTKFVEVWGKNYVGYIYTVTVEVEDGTEEVYDITIIYLSNAYVVADCEPVTK